MSVIRWQFYATKAEPFNTIRFDGIDISVGDFKELIMKEKNIKPEVSKLEVIDANTNEEYTDETDMIPRNKSVYVKKVPLRLVAGPLESIKASESQEMTAKDLIENQGVNLETANASEEAKLKALMDRVEKDFNVTSQSAAYAQGKYRFQKPPPNYTCFNCGGKDHFRNQCPKGRGEHRMSIKTATGIPQSQLTSIGKLVPGVMKDSKGKLVVLTTDLGVQRKKPERTGDSADSQEVVIPSELICELCNNLVTDAVIIPCCHESYCDGCIRNHLLEHDFKCPNCFKSMSPDNLVINKGVRSYSQKFRSELKPGMKLVPPKKSEVKIEEMGGGSKSKEPSRSNSPSVPNEPSVVTKEEAGTVTKTVAEPTVPAENTSEQLRDSSKFTSQPAPITTTFPVSQPLPPVVTSLAPQIHVTAPPMRPALQAPALTGLPLGLAHSTPMVQPLNPFVAGTLGGMISQVPNQFHPTLNPLLASHLVPKPAASAMDLNQSHPQGMLSKEEFLKLKEAAWKKELDTKVKKRSKRRMRSNSQSPASRSSSPSPTPIRAKSSKKSRSRSPAPKSSKKHSSKKHRDVGKKEKHEKASSRSSSKKNKTRRRSRSSSEEVSSTREKGSYEAEGQLSPGRDSDIDSACSVRSNQSSPSSTNISDRGDSPKEMRSKVENYEQKISPGNPHLTEDTKERKINAGDLPAESYQRDEEKPKICTDDKTILSHGSSEEDGVQVHVDEELDGYDEKTQPQANNAVDLEEGELSEEGEVSDVNIAKQPQSGNDLTKALSEDLDEIKEPPKSPSNPIYSSPNAKKKRKYKASSSECLSSDSAKDSDIDSSNKSETEYKLERRKKKKHTSEAHRHTKRHGEKSSRKKLKKSDSDRHSHSRKEKHRRRDYEYDERSSKKSKPEKRRKLKHSSEESSSRSRYKKSSKHRKH